MGFYFLHNAFYPLIFAAVFLLANLFIHYRFPAVDPYILPVVAFLSGIGMIILLRLAPDLAALRSETIASALRNHPGIKITDNVALLSQLGLKQLTNMVGGVLLLLAGFTFSSRRALAWCASKKYLWAFSAIVLVVITMIYGKEINNRRLWLFGFQTVELVKLCVLFFIAGYLDEHGRGIELYRQGNLPSWIKYAGPYFVVFILILLVLFLQKDLGPAFLLFLVFLLMIHAAGNRKIVTLAFLCIVLLAGFVAYQTGFPSMVRTRFDAFMDPFGTSESMTRVLWSLSAGGIWGVGLGAGQAYRIPEVQSDFNFTAICEELGFGVGMAVIIIYLLFFYRCLTASRQIEHGFEKSLLIGIGTLTMTQALIIIAGNIGIIPLTGITLPFVSYGGSSLIMNFIMAGIALRISTRRT
jgi:cell division protein FtsW (lipid II flippase)